MQFDFKKVRMDILAVVAFLVLAFMFCYPQLQGKKVSQHDNISWQGMAKEGMTYHEATGNDVLWSNSMFGGMPTYTYYIGTKGLNFVGSVQEILQVVGKPAYFFFIAMVCFFILMRVLKVSRWLGAVGAVAYAFSSYNAIIIAVGHDTKMLTMAYLPAALAGLFLLFRGRRLSGAALFGISMALIFINSHFQVVFYALIMFACFAVAMLAIAVKQNKVKDFLISAAIAAVTFAVAVGPSMPGVLTTSEYAKETMRGGASELSGHDKKTNGGLDKEYAFRWSNGIGETFCIMIPYLYGGSSGEPAEKAPKTYEAIGGRAEELPLYWGPQPFISGPVYFGAVVCFLFVLGLIAIRSPHKWWILAASVICIVLSWGKNFEGVNYLLFDTVPYLNKFRTPSMAMVIPQFLFPLLGIWAVQEVISRKDDAGIWKQVMMAAGITAGLCLVLGVGGSMFFDFTGGSDARMQPELVKMLKEDRQSLASASGLKSAVYILLAAGLLWAFIKNKIKPAMLIAGLGIVIAIDLIPVAASYLGDKEYVDAADYENIFVPREVDKQILRDPDPYYRVLDLTKDTYNDAVQAYFHKSIGGYSPAKMEMYQDLIDRQMSRGFNSEVLNMLNTKYIIAGRSEQEARVLPNPTACGNAWFVEEIKWANTADEEMSSLNASIIGDTVEMPNGFNPRKTAVIRTKFKNDIGNYTFGKDSASAVKLAKYGLNDISFASSNSKDGLAVFSDIYYDKGWEAFVDGKQTPIVKANYVLRAIKVPAGNHNIEFHFRPKSFYTGKTMSTISSVLLFGLCLAAFYPLFKKEKSPAEKKA
ncbi:MAG: YfhO family protein [Bacteroidota bacterium]